MKKTIILLALLLQVFFCLGQREYLGVKLGVNFSNQVAEERNYPTEGFRKGAMVAINYGQVWSDRYIVEIGVLYIQKGFRSSILITDDSGMEAGKIVVKNNFDYLGLPIKAGYRLGKKLSLISKVGFTPLVLINAKEKFENETTFSAINPILPERDLMSVMQKIDVNFLLEFDVSYLIKPGIRLTGLISLQHSLLNSFKESDFYRKNIGAVTALGLQYDLTNFKG